MSNEVVHPAVADLDKFKMLKGVTMTVRENLLHVARELHLETGHVLIHQGAPNNYMFLLVDGELAVHLDEVETEPLAIVQPGEVVGEMSLLDGSVASAFVTAHSPCTVLAVDEEAFWGITKDSHAFALNLLVKLTERLRSNNSTVSTNVKQRRKFERHAMFDGLTGIYNRRWLDETLTDLVTRHDREQGNLSLSLIDIDHFKKFNDTFGHDAGDHVLTVVAATMAANLNPTDLVARFGGEEFVIIFPETTIDEALIVANRVRKAVENEPLEMKDGTKLPSVTISMGIAEREVGQSVPTLLKIADAAMYRAKDAGRNRAFAGTKDELDV